MDYIEAPITKEFQDYIIVR